MPHIVKKLVSAEIQYGYLYLTGYRRLGNCPGVGQRVTIIDSDGEEFHKSMHANHPGQISAMTELYQKHESQEGDAVTIEVRPNEPGVLRISFKIEERIETDEQMEVAGLVEFAYEEDLRNYLAKNLSVIEPGLNLYQEEEGITGVEFPVGGRFIDILAVDATRALVVIELKVSRGYDRVVGQLMRYLAWIKRNKAERGQQVRGIIVAREISEDLLLACSLLSGVQLFEYELSLKLKPVNVADFT